MKRRNKSVNYSVGTSFLLDRPDEMDGKFPSNYKCRSYPTEKVKALIKSFIVDYVNSFDFSNNSANKSENDCWKETFNGNVPDYFYNYVLASDFKRLNFSELEEIVENLPDGKYITDAYDQHWLAQNCDTYGLEEFDSDIDV